MIKYMATQGSFDNLAVQAAEPRAALAGFDAKLPMGLMSVSRAESLTDNEGMTKTFRDTRFNDVPRAANYPLLDEKETVCRVDDKARLAQIVQKKRELLRASLVAAETPVGLIEGQIEALGTGIEVLVPATRPDGQTPAPGDFYREKVLEMSITGKEFNLKTTINKPRKAPKIHRAVSGAGTMYFGGPMAVEEYHRGIDSPLYLVIKS